jgi:hypothetical protein
LDGIRYLNLFSSFKDTKRLEKLNNQIADLEVGHIEQEILHKWKWLQNKLENI